MKKFITVSMFALSLISAASAAPILNDGKEVLSKHPLGVEYRSKEYGGTKDAIDAYSDGVGVYVGGANPNKSVNQAPMNKLVAKYGESAKAKGVTVAEEVAYGGVATEADKVLLSKAMDISTIHPDGTICNDGNALTINDKYTSGACNGVLPPPDGTQCGIETSDTHVMAYYNGKCVTKHFLFTNSSVYGLTINHVGYDCQDIGVLTYKKIDNLGTYLSKPVNTQNEAKEVAKTICRKYNGKDISVF